MFFEICVCIIIPIIILYYLLIQNIPEDHLFEDICNHRVHTLWWLHRKKWHRIEIQSQTTAKRPKSTVGDITKRNGIIIQHFIIDGVVKKTDSFRMNKLYRFRF